MQPQPFGYPAWECFTCQDGFHYAPGICMTCGVEFRRVPMLSEA